MDKIPVISIEPLISGEASDKTIVAREIRCACETIGFFCVTGHGIPEQIIEDVRSQAVSFFSLPTSQKSKFTIERGRYSGYIPLNQFSANAGSHRPDHYEGFKLHTENDGQRVEASIVPENCWPDKPEKFRDTIINYLSEMNSLQIHLLHGFALALNLPPDAFDKYFIGSASNMTLLHYPAVEKNSDDIGIHPHKDSDAFTILYPDPVGGLEVRPISGSWITVNCPANAFVVNIGDMMELWSGGRFVSTPHRVINKTGLERYSFPYFATPSELVTIEPKLPYCRGRERPPLKVGYFLSELYRTNWADQAPHDVSLDLGTVTD